MSTPRECASPEQSPPHFPTVGVVGGGQLARMMAPAATGLGVRLVVLADSPEDAAAQVIPTALLGSAGDLDDLRSLAEASTVTTFEHEHIDTEHHSSLEADGHVLRPSSAALAAARDKLHMRTTLTDLGHPCPDWVQAQSVDDIERFRGEHGGHAVVKAIRGGYDGKGVRLVSSPADVASCADWLDALGTVLVEERVDYVRELAVLVARSPSGQAAAWSIVESIQVDGVCSEVIAPAPDLDEALGADALATALHVAGDLDVTGVLAVEGFQTPDGRFLINELAMRPHNSGHWTIDGAVTSQFEQHLRAVLDLPLGDTSARAPWTVMANVFGADHEHMYPAYLHVMARDPGVKVHMYGKDVRPGRKIGHVTVCGDDLAACRERARHAADFLQGVIDE